MKWLSKLVAPLVAALALSACTSMGSQSLTPPISTPCEVNCTDSQVKHEAADRYVYVTEASHPATLQVFPHGAQNPVATYTLAGRGFGVTVDDEGYVYVAEPDINAVAVYGPGTKGYLYSITSGLHNPTGLFVGKDDTLYVSSIAYVAEFHHGGLNPFHQISGAPGFNIWAEIVDDNGNMFAYENQSEGGEIFFYPHGLNPVLWDIVPEGDNNGLGFSPSGQIMSNFGTSIAWFDPVNPSNLLKIVDLGTGSLVRYIGSDTEGNYCFPIESLSSPRVGVHLKYLASQANFTIKGSIHAPIGCAVSR